MKISIVTAYYNRKRLFLRTLESIQRQITDFKLEVELIVVDDGSTTDQRLEDVVERFPFMNIVRLEPENKWYRNSCVPFNCGFEYATGELVVIQNPECFHYGNILEFVNINGQKGKYLSFACFSLDKNTTDTESLFYDPLNLKQLIKTHDRVVQHDGDLGWYNHSIHRPAAYHFCSAIHRDDLFALGGFDERYARGIGFDDDEFVHRIKSKPLEIQFADQEIVLHQNHYLDPSVGLQKRTWYIDSPYFLRNKQLFHHMLVNQTNNWFVGALMNREHPVLIPIADELQKNIFLRVLYRLKRKLIPRK